MQPNTIISDSLEFGGTRVFFSISAIPKTLADSHEKQQTASLSKQILLQINGSRGNIFNLNKNHRGDLWDVLAQFLLQQECSLKRVHLKAFVTV
jgi:hypothetical protein